MSEKQLRIALAQTCPISAPDTASATFDPSAPLLGPFEKNLAKVAEWTEKASRQGADVVVFPEYFLQGIVDGKEYMVHPAQHAIDYLCALAKKHSISIVGTIVEPQMKSVTTMTSSVPEPTTSPFSHLLSENTPDSAIRESWHDFFVARYPHCFDASLPSASEKRKELDPDSKDLPAPAVDDEPSLMDQAKEVAGLSTEKTSTPEKERPLYMSNTAYYIDGDTGTVTGQYSKKNLWIPEREYLVAGDNSHEVFDTKWGKAGFLICWDFSRPAAAASLAQQGVDIIFGPTFWMGFDSEPGIKPHSPPQDYELTLLQSLAYTRAFESETAVVMVNAGGPVAEGYIGGSGVWMPFKGMLGGVGVGEGQDGEKVEGMRVVQVDLSVLRDSRRTYQIRTDQVGKIGSL
ncbi:carbon-nitrogen hydrolase [Athelia psychrophila]|uniref:Carbon-nitrogen hydrolase n=1 Tax=Athelia psychrophila TaxID=1759441 RepID=A0A166EGM5_9AGAM|nr:carbon-nitrogen hydrolase [Fibularhizoctonia sp. CBS 109695]